jgi:hypothetical protein
MLRAVCLLLLLLVLAVPCHAQEGTIGIYDLDIGFCSYSPNLYDCVVYLTEQEPKELYILARPEIYFTNGLAGAEFRVSGKPAGMITISMPNPSASHTLGDPFDGSGANIAFTGCQEQNAEDIVLLYTVTVTNVGMNGDALLHIEKRDPPSNPNFPCPLINDCDAPAYTAYCAIGSQMLVHPVTIAVEAGTFGQIKELYR